MLTAKGSLRGSIDLPYHGLPVSFRPVSFDEKRFMINFECKKLLPLGKVAHRAKRQISTLSRKFPSTPHFAQLQVICRIGIGTRDLLYNQN